MDIRGLHLNTTQLQNDLMAHVNMTTIGLDLLINEQNETNIDLQSVIHNVTRLQTDVSDTAPPRGHIINDIQHVHTVDEAFIRQDGSDGKSNKVDIRGNSENRPGTENMIRQDGSHGKSNKVSLHREDGR